MEELLRRDVPLLPRIEIEDFNSYTVIVDIDGNGWSDRLVRLACFNTPLLKQQSRSSKEYFGHLLENGTHVVFFSSDLSDLVPLLEDFLRQCREIPDRCLKMVRNMQSFARKHLSHLGVLRAMAYALNEFGKKIPWRPRLEDAYEEIPPSICCGMNPSLPEELIHKVENSGSEEGHVDPIEQVLDVQSQEGKNPHRVIQDGKNHEGCL